MDIHLPVLGAAADAARAANAVLNAGLNSTAIDFANGAHTPHITLYLTQWSCDGLPAGAGSIGSGAPLSCLEKIETAIAEVLKHHLELELPGRRLDIISERCRRKHVRIAGSLTEPHPEAAAET